VVDRIVERVPGELLAASPRPRCSLRHVLVWLRRRSRVRVAQRAAHADPLTGIANRLAFQHRLADEWKRARRYERPLGVQILDIDGLKQVNDSDGHLAGDRMIRTAAERIADDIRHSDLAARLAGDEFVVLCPETQGLAQQLTKLDHG
jgi:diguanylate cyclase (GGDEF)-like protein